MRRCAWTVTAPCLGSALGHAFDQGGLTTRPVRRPRQGGPRARAKGRPDPLVRLRSHLRARAKGRPDPGARDAPPLLVGPRTAATLPRAAHLYQRKAGGGRPRLRSSTTRLGPDLSNRHLPARAKGRPDPGRGCGRRPLPPYHLYQRKGQQGAPGDGLPGGIFVC